MTRKHFQAIADTIREGFRENEMRTTDAQAHGNTTLIRHAYRTADYLATTNPAFDRQRFLKAAGVL